MIKPRGRRLPCGRGPPRRPDGPVRGGCARRAQSVLSPGSVHRNPRCGMHGSAPTMEPAAPASVRRALPPDRRLADLLVLIHQSNGHLSNNKRKQRFEELTNEEIVAIESAYAEVFQLPDQRVVPVGGVALSPDAAVGAAQETQPSSPLPAPREKSRRHRR